MSSGGGEVTDCRETNGESLQKLGEELYFVPRGEIYGELERRLFERLGYRAKILKTQNGKPYVEGTPLCISLAHSGDRGVFIISKSPVGIDLELYGRGVPKGVFNSFSERERGEITCEDGFLAHWTAREAFIKLNGYNLWESVKHIEFFGGKLYYFGQQADVELSFERFKFGVACVCRGKL